MRADAVPLKHILQDPANVRRYFSATAICDLADSIAEYGMLENLVVREGRDCVFIVAGERRWRALHELVERKVLTVDEPIRVVVVDGKGTFENLVENLCREDIPSWELGFRFLELSEAGYPQKEIAARIGKTQGYVSRFMAISRGLHPATVSMLERMRSKLTDGELMKISALLDGKGEPDQAAQQAAIEKYVTGRGSRLRKPAQRKDSDKVLRRIAHMQNIMKIPAHAQPYVDVILNYLLNRQTSKIIKFPEEI